MILKKFYNEWSLYILRVDFILNVVYINICIDIDGIIYNIYGSYYLFYYEWSLNILYIFYEVYICYIYVYVYIKLYNCNLIIGW